MQTLHLPSTAPRSCNGQMECRVCRDAPEHRIRDWHSPHQMASPETADRECSGNWHVYPQMDICLLGFHREERKNVPNLEISGGSAEQGNRGCITHWRVTRRRPVRHVLFCLFATSHRGNQLLWQRLPLLTKNLASRLWLMQCKKEKKKKFIFQCKASSNSKHHPLMQQEAKCSSWFPLGGSWASGAEGKGSLSPTEVSAHRANRCRPSSQSW